LEEGQLIQLVATEEWYQEPNEPPRIVLRPTTLDLPADRRLVVLGRRRSANSRFLRLLAGITWPTRGRVIAKVRLSPILSANGLFHPYFNGVENVRHFARMLNLHPDQLLLAIDSFSGSTGFLGGVAKVEEQDPRRQAMMGLLTLLPFDCYLIDEIAQFSEAVVWRHLDAVAPRGAGMIFTTSSRRHAQRYADCALVLRDAVVHPFSSVEKAFAFYER
jgi:ABC-type polysaccharide/polyol phosphate transport system ATPase subunit